VYKNVIVLHVIRFAEEIRDPKEVKIPTTKTSDKEIAMAESLIENYTEKFNFKKYKDVYNEQLLKIIDSKASGKKVKVEKAEKSEPTAAKDLMAKLKASLEQRKKKAS
jgi:DNA end-binding protein Ku